MLLKQKLFMLSSLGIFGLAYLIGSVLDMPSFMLFVFITGICAGFVLSEMANLLSIDLEKILMKYKTPKESNT